MIADTRLNAYLILLAPVLARIDGVTDDPADVEMAEAILTAAESADGVGLTRSEIAARAGVDADDPRFGSRLDLLSRAGALQHLRGDKKHQIRYSEPAGQTRRPFVWAGNAGSKRTLPISASGLQTVVDAAL